MEFSSQASGKVWAKFGQVQAKFRPTSGKVQASSGKVWAKFGQVQAKFRQSLGKFGQSLG